MKKLLIFTLLLCCTVKALSYTERNYLQKQANVSSLQEVLILNQQWVTYPAYTDRTGWDTFLGSFKNECILRGEKQLNYQWQVVKATDYMEFERSGNRSVMETPFANNNNAIADLLLAELAEGKGRFIDQLINGVYHSCEMTSWALAAHLNAQQSHRSLPDFKENIIDLTAGDLGSLLAWTYYYMHKEFDKLNPAISERLRHTLQQRILDPYMNNDHFWWMAVDYRPGMLVNNWNPWCNSNALMCFMLLENDKEMLAKAIYRSMVSVDKFINYTHTDGACEEGPSYWGHAAGKMFDYLELLSAVTGGTVSIFDNPMIKNMGEYISRSYVGKGWVVNFADASAKGSGDAPLIFRYGKAVNSNEMKGFAAMINTNKLPSGRDIYRTLAAIKIANELKETQAAHLTPPFSWYPETEFCYITDNKGNFLAAKGGYNDESHNHNDAGTFSFWIDQTPFLIDAGVGTYTRQTFSKDRYTIWTMQSNYHNLPLINGVPQRYGATYKATQVQADKRKNTFTANIATAYPAEAEVESWIRSYSLQKGQLRISDSFRLTTAKQPNQINFMTWGQVNTEIPGKIQLEVKGKKAVIEYDKQLFDVKTEIIPLTDTRLSNVWGKSICRITLTATNIYKTGNYSFTIKKQ